MSYTVSELRDLKGMETGKNQRQPSGSQVHKALTNHISIWIRPYKTSCYSSVGWLHMVVQVEH